MAVDTTATVSERSDRVVAGLPVVFLVRFVYVFGGTLGAGLARPGGRAVYLAYVIRGILVMAPARPRGRQSRSTWPLTEGLARFRTMAKMRPADPTGPRGAATSRAAWHRPRGWPSRGFGPELPHAWVAAVGVRP